MHRPQYQQNVANAKRQRVSMRVPLAYAWYVATIYDLTEAGGEQLRCECEHGVGVQKSRCENYIEVEDFHFGWRLCELCRPLPEDFARQARAMSNYVCANDHSLCRANPHMRADVDAGTYERTVTILQRQTHAACRCLCEGCAGPDVGAPSSDGVEYSWHRAYGINNRKGPAK